MKLTVKKPCEIEAKCIQIEVAVRYDEEDIPNDFPLRKGDMWNATVEIDTGMILDWPQWDRDADVHMKVCDQGTYRLIGHDGSVLASIEENYVPSCVPGRYGDYIELDINKSGKITNWKEFCTKENVMESFFGSDE